MILRDPSRATTTTGGLTTNHPTSSYGQPVLALEDGIALGTADLPHWAIIVLGRHELLPLARWLGRVGPADVALATGNAEDTVRKWCRELDVPRRGRDYSLTPEQVEQILARMQTAPGRPRST